MRLTSLLAAMILVSGCGGAAEARYEITLSAAEVKHLGVNMTGRTDISDSDWMEIAARACTEGAWDWDVAERIFDEELGELAPNTEMGGAQSVWLLLTGTCHELIPQDAIDRGPPPPGY